jgi:hypothetical protein
MKTTTIYGNAAIVRSRKSKTAFDVDMGERVPIELVDMPERKRIKKPSLTTLKLIALYEEQNALLRKELAKK